MADSKDASSFFRKVVKFVSSSSSEWVELSVANSGGSEAEFDKSELKAMIERKRRNDFVRKCEFDMLRKVRREGLSSEQRATLEISSRIDDTEDRNDTRPHQVKAKIDAIEQQMVSERWSEMTKPNSSFYAAPTQPAKLDGPPVGKEIPVLGMRPDEIIAMPSPPQPLIYPEPANRPSQHFESDTQVPPVPLVPARPLPTLNLPASSAGLRAAATTTLTHNTPLFPPRASLLTGPPSEHFLVPTLHVEPAQKDQYSPETFESPPRSLPAVFFPKVSVETSSPADHPVRVAPAHSIFSSLDSSVLSWPEQTEKSPIPPDSSPWLIDPALQPKNIKASISIVSAPEKAIEPNNMAPISGLENSPEFNDLMIAFANAEFKSCEQSLLSLIAAGGLKEYHSESWLVLFDFYRATGESAKFEALALDYCIKFGLSSPQWVSLPAMLVKPPLGKMGAVSEGSKHGKPNWVCPEHLDQDAVSRLQSMSISMPQPWLFEWTALKSIDAQACSALAKVFQFWSNQRVKIHCAGGDQLFTILENLCRAEHRELAPAFWDLRFEAFRMANRPAAFDDAAIDYCITYEVSPPSWEAPQCEVQISHSQNQQAWLFSGVFSNPELKSHQPSVVSQKTSTNSLELSGHLLGNMTATLARLDHHIKEDPVISISCAHLIRVDFIAAGDLLNWVLAKRQQKKSIIFTDVHRLVALFFGATGISQYAKLKVRTI